VAAAPAGDAAWPTWLVGPNLECTDSLRAGVEELGAPSMEGGVVMENDIGSDGVAVPGLDWSES
jgi:hypothetical protein